MNKIEEEKFMKNVKTFYQQFSTFFSEYTFQGLSTLPTSIIIKIKFRKKKKKTKKSQKNKKRKRKPKFL